MIDNNTQMKEHSSSREGIRQKFWAAIRKPSRRMGLIAIMGFVLCSRIVVLCTLLPAASNGKN